MKQKGFTLIELVVVIVILGILAATALPKFVDLSGDAEQAAVQGVAGAVSSAGSLNFAQRKISSAAGVAISDTTDACAGAANSVFAGGPNLIQGSVRLVNAAPTTSNEYRVTATAGVCAAGATAECRLTSQNNKTAQAFVPCTN